MGLFYWYSLQHAWIKMASVTCVEVVVCTPLPKHGEDGIVVATSLNVDTLCALLLLLCQHLLWPKDTKLKMSLKFHWLSVMTFKVSRKPRKLLVFSSASRPTMTSKRS